MQHRFYTYLMRLLGVLAVVVFIQIPTVVLAEAAQSEEQLVAALYKQAQEQWQSGAKDQAMATVNKAIARFPNDANIYYLRGGFLSELKRYAAAIADMRRVTELAPEFAGAWGSLGWYLILQGDFPAAQEASAKAQALDTNSFAWAVNLGHTYFLQGDRKTAEEWYRKSMPLLTDEAALQSGPLADFDIFIAQGWQVAASRQERAWYEREAKPLVEATSLNSQVTSLYQQGKYAGALPLAQRVLAIREKVLGPEHPAVATSLNNLAELYRSQGQYAQAEPLYQRALAIREKVLGPEHPHVATSLNNLAELYQSQGQYAQAEPLYQRALAIREKVLGPEHPDVATSLNNLAGLYKSQGQYAQAEPLYQRSLAIYEKVLGPEHPHVAASLNNLAGLYESQGQYAQAEPLYQRALAIVEKALGPEHPHVAASLNNLAGLYKSQGQYAQAEPLYQRSLAILEKVLGPEHPDVATSLNNLAGLYKSQGQYAQAEPLYQRALAIREKALGPEHPDVAASLNNLADLYRSQGQYAQAEPLHQRALVIREKVLGPEHSDVAQSLNNLAVLYDSQGQYAQAERLYQRALAIVEKALGPEHPDVATSLNNLAELYQSQGQYAQAEPLYQRALAIGEKVLGPEHPDVAGSLNNLAVLYYSQGQYAQAEPLYQRALAIGEKVLGPEHPAVATSLNNLAGLYKSQGQYAQAEPLHQRALAIREKVLGPEHPDVATSLNNLAELYQSQGQYAQAEPLHQRALAIREKALGPEHPDVATSLGNMAGLYHAKNKYSLALDYIRRANRIYHDRILDNSRVVTSGGDSERGGFKATFKWHIGIAAARMAEDPSMRAELTAESFEIGQLFHDGAVGEALAKMAARFAGGNDQLANLARDKEDAQMAWQKADANLIEALGKPTAEQNSTLIQNLRTQAQGLQTELTGLNERLAKEFPDYVELTIPRPATIPQVQKLLNPGEGLVAYVLGLTKSWVWLITPDAASFRQIDRSAKDIETQVQELRANLSPDSNPRLTAFPATVAHALYQDLLGPEAERLAKVKTLFVVADGALESLPFSVLVTAQPQGDPKDYQHIPWLSRTLATVTLPTVSSLRALRTLATKGKPAAKPFIGFGNPDFGTSDSGATRSGRSNRSSKTRRSTTRTTKDRTAATLALTRGAMANPDELRKMLPLPETADELRAIAKTLGAAPQAVILGKKATVPAVITSPLAQYRVVDFATHALVAGQIEEFKIGGGVEPAIVLTPPKVATPDNDGLLRASQVAQLKLNADWVVLSACNTAAPDGTPGAAGLSGLAKAFFYAGARAMLVSHWSVISKPAVGITTHMFETWNNHPELGRAEALRLAMMHTLDNPTDRRFTHPAAWAPFVVAGEGGIDVTRTTAVDFSMFHTTAIETIPITEGATLKSGDGYFFHIKTAAASQNYFYVYQVDSANKVFRLFPSRQYRTATNPIPANTRVTVPNDGEEFFLDKVTGTETFYFFASATSVPALERLENGTLDDLKQSGLDIRGPAGVRPKMDSVAARTGETTSETQQFRFAEYLTHSFSINHK